MKFEDLKNAQRGDALLSGRYKEYLFLCFSLSGKSFAAEDEHSHIFNWSEKEIENWTFPEPKKELFWRRLFETSRRAHRVTETFYSDTDQVYGKYLKYGNPIDNKGVE